MLACVITGQLVIGSGLLSEAQTPSPSPSSSVSGMDVGGRLVLREGGYAVTFPAGWRVQIHPLDDPIPVVDAQEPSKGSAMDDAAYCWIRVHRPCGDGAASSCATFVDEAAAREVAWLESGTDVPVPSIIESAVLTLPAGYSVRVREEHSDPEWERAYYRMTDGRAMASLGCTATHGPDDHWLSIAETFEFLPEE